MRYFKILSLSALIFLLSHCVSSRVTPCPGFNYAPTNPDNVQIYNMPPSIAFEIIGEAEEEGGMISYKIALSNMKKKAAAIGGDAIVLISKRERYIGTYTTPSQANAFIYGNYIYYTYRPRTSLAMHRKHFIGLIIKWKRK